MSGNNSSEASQSSTDRRKYIRVDIFAVTRYFNALRRQEVGVQTRIADISEGGALMLTFGEGIPLGTSVRLNFSLPDAVGTPIAIEGEIRHTSLLERDLYRSGLQFFNVKENDLKAIRKYIVGQKK